MNTQERIEICTEWFKTLTVGNYVSDIKHNRKNKITGLTGNSVELYHTKITNKGINCKQWYDIQRLAFLTNDFITNDKK